MTQFQLSHNMAISKVTQTRNWVATNIEAGAFQKNEQLLSINAFNFKFSVARDTVEKAYNILKEEGYVTSVKGKGYFVTGLADKKLRVLLCFNKLSSYKKIVYEAVVETLGKNATHSPIRSPTLKLMLKTIITLLLCLIFSSLLKHQTIWMC